MDGRHRPGEGDATGKSQTISKEECLGLGYVESHTLELNACLGLGYVEGHTIAAREQRAQAQSHSRVGRCPSSKASKGNDIVGIGRSEVSSGCSSNVYLCMLVWKNVMMRALCVSEHPLNLKWT